MRAAVALICLTVSAAATAQPVLTPADEAAAFAAAGFERVDGQWRACGDPGTASYQSGTIEQVADLNGDDRPEALIIEGSTFCYGNTAAGYALVSKQPDGGWKLMTSGPGIPTPLQTKGAGGWPDLEIGGPGFCFAVKRWDGKAYQLHRFEYEGRACKLSE